MQLKDLKPILKRYRKRIFMYDWEFFSMRIHDEITISILEEYQFLYVEISFSAVEKRLPKKSDCLKFWNAFFYQLDQKRYSDLCGFLDNDRGIALIFTYSNSTNNNAAWTRFCERILSETGFDIQKWEEIIHSEYPPKEFFKKT